MSGCTAQGSRGQRREWAYEASCSRKEKGVTSPEQSSVLLSLGREQHGPNCDK